VFEQLSNAGTHSWPVNEKALVGSIGWRDQGYRCLHGGALDDQVGA